MIKIIKSKDNKIIKYALFLKTNKGRKESNHFLCESKKSLELAIKSNLVTDVFLLKEMSELPSYINQYLISDELMRKISNTENPEGVIFIANNLTMNVPTDAQKILYLDHISDPGNMGTIIRTGLAFGYDAIVMSEGCVSIYNEKVLASAKGGLFLIPLCIAPISFFKDKYEIIVSSLDSDSEVLQKRKTNSPFVLVLGNEAHGVSKDLLKYADKKVRIPMSNIDSLNVSVACGILMYELSK